jgi:hypothetical protein
MGKADSFGPENVNQTRCALGKVKANRVTEMTNLPAKGSLRQRQYLNRQL